MTTPKGDEMNDGPKGSYAEVNGLEIYYDLTADNAHDGTLKRN